MGPFDGDEEVMAGREELRLALGPCRSVDGRFCVHRTSKSEQNLHLFGIPQVGAHLISWPWQKLQAFQFCIVEAQRCPWVRAVIKVLVFGS
jgi:hypothetical protein